MFYYHYMNTKKGIFSCYFSIYGWLLYAKYLNYAVKSLLIEAFFSLQHYIVNNKSASTSVKSEGETVSR